MWIIDANTSSIAIIRDLSSVQKKKLIAAAHVKAGCVQVRLLELNVRILFSYLVAAGKEESICPPPEGERKTSLLA